MTDYKPIDCGLHSEYELAILQSRKLRVCWNDSHGQSYVELLKPVDLRTRNHEEFLEAEKRNGTRLEIRLDRIVTAEDY